MQPIIAVVSHGQRNKMAMNEAIHKLLSMDEPPTIEVGGESSLAELPIRINTLDAQSEKDESS